MVVSFVDLVKDCTVPIVLYRPEAAAHDLGLYGSSHVGMLGGIVKPTNVEKILQCDLLKTDFFRGPAEPTFLYYNPYDTDKQVELELGPNPRDVYDAVNRTTLLHNLKGLVRFAIAPDAARVLVIVPPGAKLVQEASLERGTAKQ